MGNRDVHSHELKENCNLYYNTHYKINNIIKIW